ncbi:phage holin family protein [Patescibacteria group bacterium]|nr:phage holin family protein [Patescibacteria group bacterium]
MVLRFVWKIAANSLALFVAAHYLNGFIIRGGILSLLVGGIVLALIHIIIRPILRLLSFPFLILTLGFFNIVINIALLLIADYLLPQLQITDFWSLFWGSIIVSIANIIS